MFTAREREVLRLVATGPANEQIAQRLVDDWFPVRTPGYRGEYAWPDKPWRSPLSAVAVRCQRPTGPHRPRP